ncbi:MAG: hypothetical protein ACI3ZP_09365 [Candidatus Cryptobacteroides sp.]
MAIPEPAPRSVKHLGYNQYVIGGDDVKRQFGGKALHIDSLTISSIERAIIRVYNHVRQHPDCQYYATCIGKKKGDNKQKDIALCFLPLIFCHNVHLPEEYIRYIANEAHDNPTQVAHLQQNQISDLLDKWMEFRKEAIRKDYSDLFVIFDDKKLNFSHVLVNLIASAERGEYKEGERLNQIRSILECIFERMMEMKMLPEDLRGSDSKCGKYIKDRKDIPEYIKKYIYAINGVVNSGSHAWLKENNENDGDDAQIEDKKQNKNFIEYQSAVNNGELRYLTRSLVFMLLCVVDWCVKEMGKRSQIAE